MKLRAAIFDVYKTILDVGPPPDDAAIQWRTLWRDHLGGEPRIDLAGFGASCDRIVAREHAAARATGIERPEIYWPEVVQEILPELAALPPEHRADFMLQQVGLWHAIRLMPGAADILRRLPDRGIVLGIASNAQPYTLRELDQALATAGLSRELFAPDLCFWSFEHGFSKPDPHVFRLLTARLRARGIPPAAALMIGDRLDNDIAPALAQGWQAWQLTSRPAVERILAGSWTELAAQIEGRIG